MSFKQAFPKSPKAEETNVLKGFISPQDKVKAIEDEVEKELNHDWQILERERQEKEEINNHIKEFYERMLSKYKTKQG